MKYSIALCLSVTAILLFNSGCWAAAHPDEPSLFDSRQALVVTSDSWEATTGQLQLFERDSPSTPWTPVGNAIPVSLGRTGMAWGRGLHTVPSPAHPEKHEGDGKAPAGIFKISTAFGETQTDATNTFPFIKISSDFECVEDVNSSNYNRIVDGTTQPRDWKSSETMLRLDGLYAVGAFVDHNSDPVVPGKGSCIFLHIWRGPGQPTAGCTAMEEAALRSLLSRLEAGRKPLLVQLPRVEYQRLRKEWGLP